MFGPYNVTRLKIADVIFTVKHIKLPSRSYVWDIISYSKLFLNKIATPRAFVQVPWI